MWLPFFLNCGAFDLSYPARRSIDSPEDLTFVGRQSVLRWGRWECLQGSGEEIVTAVAGEALRMATRCLIPEQEEAVPLTRALCPQRRLMPIEVPESAIKGLDGMSGWCMRLPVGLHAVAFQISRRPRP
jgi:hypothetical protein